MAEFDDGASADRVDGLAQQMKRLDAITGQFGRTLSRSLASGIAQGKGFEDILRNIGQKMIELALRSAFKPLESGIGNLLSGLVKGVTGAFSGAGGGSVPGSGSVTPFAEGGVISTPHYFPLGKGLGLAGERGAEAILPLSRGADGRLGVASRGGGAVTVHMSVSTPDADSFRRSEAQVGAALARAVARGQRNL